MNTPTPLQNVLNAIDAANAQDSNTTNVDGELQAKELVYGQRMSATLETFCPNASEPLCIAARAQHIERWKSARSDYPEGRAGYKKWRAELALFHGTRAGELMLAEGYDEETIARVRYLIQKRQLKRDNETQTLEDVACLVFLNYYLEEFVAKHEEPKLIDIIQKTWKKMSDKGHEAALKLSFSENSLKLIQKSLA